jgi:hypothetical protein
MKMGNLEEADLEKVSSLIIYHATKHQNANLYYPKNEKIKQEEIIFKMWHKHQ